MKKYRLIHHPEDPYTPYWLEVNNPIKILWWTFDNWIPCPLTINNEVWFWGEQLKFSSPRAADEFIRMNLQV